MAQKAIVESRPAAPDPTPVVHIDHLNLTVRSIDESIAFYARLFGFVAVERGEPDPYPWTVLRSGNALLCIYEHPNLETGPKYPEPPLTQDVRHFAFRIKDGDAFARLAAHHGVPLAYGGPVRWPHSTSYYIADPTGHQIEVVAWDDDAITFDPMN
jgi:catechol 2,3-dioxygenase-like lactoylglutathione lyase family enzyme